MNQDYALRKHWAAVYYGVANNMNLQPVSAGFPPKAATSHVVYGVGDGDNMTVSPFQRAYQRAA